MAITEIDVLWITAGLGCDGETIALTGATQPSIEDLVLGGDAVDPEDQLPQSAARREERRRLPGRVSPGRRRRRLKPFILVVEGSIPDEKNKAEGYWAAFGTDAARPASRSPPASGSTGSRHRPGRSWPSGRARPTAAFMPWRAIRPAAWVCRIIWAGTGNRRRTFRSSACRAVPTQPDNFTETLLYLLHMAAGRAPMIPLDDALRPTWLFGQTVHEGCDRGGYYEQAEFADEYGSRALHRQARMLGAGGPVQRRQARLDGRHRRLSERGRHLHWLHDAGLSRQVHAVHGSAARVRCCRRTR